MSKKVLVIGGASLLAVLLLAATFLFRPASTSNTGPQTQPSLQPGQLPPGVRLRQTDDDLLAGAGPIRKYVVEFMNKRKQLIQIRGESFTPQPHGKAHMSQPLTRIHLTPYRVIQIQAPEGIFIAPENQPRSGELVGPAGQQQVILSYYQSAPDQAINFQPNSPHLMLKILLDEVKFDLELGTVDSEGPMIASSANFEFQGKGLSLSYNELRRRLDRLEIFQGKLLRVKNAAPATSGTQRNGTTTAPGTAPATTRSQKSATTNPSSEDENQATCYLARFLEDVKVQNPDMILQGDELAAYFSLAPRQMRQDPLAGTTSAPSGNGAAASSTSGQTPTTAAQTASASLFVPAPDDLVITWAGRLTVEPQPQAAPELAGPEDVLIRLLGKPVHVVTARQEKITAQFAQYLLSSAALSLIGAKDHPVRVDSPELGTVESTRMLIDQSRASGTLFGPGLLKGRAQPPATGRPAGGQTIADAPTSAFPSDLSVAWQDRLDLTFYTRRGDAKANQRLRALKSAHFVGQVKVEHRDMDLSADKLFLALDDPQTGKQSVQQIDAAGKVAVNTRPTPQQPALAIRSDELRLELQPQADRHMRPTRMIARGHVDTSSQGRRIQAGEMIVGFTPAEKTGEPQPPIRIASLDATGEVRIDMNDPPTQLQGHRVEADVIGDLLVLSGAEGKPARVQQTDGSLTGPRIIMHQQSQTVRVEGSGEFEFLERNSSDPRSEPGSIQVKWAKSMGFDNRMGMARFVEKVQVNSRTKRDTATLQAQDLSINFIPASQDKPADAARGTLDKPSSRRIKDMLARERVVFESQNWADKPQGQMASRFRLEGDNLAFDNSSQTVKVEGPGRMFYQDVQARQAKAPPAEASSIVFADSKGSTVFTWTGKLNFDARQNQMLMQDKVEMIHQSARDSQVMQLNCSSLVAVMEKTGGIDAWMSGTAPSPKLQSVTAQGGVGIQSGNRTIRTDQMVYDAGQQTLMLKADPGKLTEIWEKGDTKPHTAQHLRWDLTRNRLEIINPGPGRIPVK